MEYWLWSQRLSFLFQHFHTLAMGTLLKSVTYEAQYTVRCLK